MLDDRLPALRAAFAAGQTTVDHIRAAVDLAIAWEDDAALRQFDENLAAAAMNTTVSSFRVRARRLKQRLLHEPAEVRHARAFADRRVWVEPTDDGMAFIHALVAAPDAVRIIERLNATARAEQKKTPSGERGWRSRDQIRVDLAVAWLAGDGTPTAAKVRPMLLVPLLSLLAQGDQPIELPGYGSIDRVSAARLFEKAPSFRRVATDPFTGELLEYDRARYRPTKAQRDWIAMRFEDCIDPTCSRSAYDSDIDHLEEWVRESGRTDADNLFPLCENGNRRKNLSRIAYRRLPSGRVSITTPTGFTAVSEPAAIPETVAVLTPSSGPEESALELAELRRECARRVARVHRPPGLDEQRRHLAVGARAVLHTARHDIDVARAEFHVTAVGVAESDDETARHHEEQLVGIGVRVPGELALRLEHLHVVVVHAGESAWRPRLRERIEGGLDVANRICHAPDHSGCRVRSRGRRRNFPGSGRRRSFPGARSARPRPLVGVSGGSSCVARWGLTRHPLGPTFKENIN